MIELVRAQRLRHAPRAQVVRMDVLIVLMHADLIPLAPPALVAPVGLLVGQHVPQAFQAVPQARREHTC